MLEEIKQLLKVQEIDKEIIHLKETLGRYPKVWEKVKDKYAKAKAEQERAAAEEERFQKERKRLDQKLRMMTDELVRAQKQQVAVKTAKEYEAATKQLEHSKRQFEDLEKRIEALLEREAEVSQGSKDAVTGLEQTEELYKTEKKRIREQFNDKKEQLAALEVQREAAIAGVSPQAQTVYNRIMSRHPGSCVVPVVNEKVAGSERGTNGCAGCYFEVLPETLVRIRTEREIITCTNCDRILFEEEDAHAEHTEVG